MSDTPGRKKAIQDKTLEREVMCPYLRALYYDRISCEAPEDTGATCLILYFNSRQNLEEWVAEECGSVRENSCPLRHLLNEQYGVEKY